VFQTQIGLGGTVLCVCGLHDHLSQTGCDGGLLLLLERSMTLDIGNPVTAVDAPHSLVGSKRQ
jgi:hypothetical protein